MKLKSFSDLQKVFPNTERKNSQSKSVGEFAHDGKGKCITVSLDTKGRNGKVITLVSGLQHNPATLEEIARLLKYHCGAGGTVKNGNLEIQGDQRAKIMEKMRSLNYKVKNF